MPELPEVEVLIRKLRPQLLNRVVRSVRVERGRTSAPNSPEELRRVLRGATFVNLIRRGKYLLFDLRPRRGTKLIRLVGHLGMSGDMYLQPFDHPLPKHAAAVLELDDRKLVFEDTRYFGRLTLDTSAPEMLGPEPLDAREPPEALARGLKRSSQAVKVKLLDQSLVAGLGNIYVSEALFLAGISPRLPAKRLTRAQIARLWRSIREVLTRAIKTGASFRPGHAGRSCVDERFYVYGRANEPCLRCDKPIKRLVQAARSTFYCVGCQRAA